MSCIGRSLYLRPEGVSRCGLETVGTQLYIDRGTTCALPTAIKRTSVAADTSWRYLARLASMVCTGPPDSSWGMSGGPNLSPKTTVVVLSRYSRVGLPAQPVKKGSIKYYFLIGSST